MAKAEAPSLRTRWRALNPILRSELAFSLIGVVLAVTLASLGAPLLIVLVSLLLFVLVMPVVVGYVGLPILIHELGHLFAARRFGLSVVAFRVLGIEFVRGASRIETPNEPFGFVQVRTTLEQDRPEVWRSFILAGPLAGFVGTVLFAAVAWVSPSSFRSLLAFLSGYSLLLSITSLIPQEKGFLSDGAVLRDIEKPDSQTFARNAVVRLLPVFQGQSPTECDPEDVRRALLVRDPRLRLYAAAVAASRAVLLLEPEATALCADYLAACEACHEANSEYAATEEHRILRQDARLELAFAQVYFERDLAAAEATLQSLDRIEWTGWSVAMRVEVARAWLLGDVERARSMVASTQAYIARQRAAKPGPGWDLTERYLELCADGLPDLRAT